MFLQVYDSDLAAMFDPKKKKPFCNAFTGSYKRPFKHTFLHSYYIM